MDTDVKMLTCSRHGLTEHVFYSGRYRCKKCYTWYNALKRKKYKKMLVDYKGGKCQICGYDKCISALEFHHINEEEKSFSISQTAFSKSFEELKKEADKCILLCANCHREIHAKIEEEKLNDHEKYKLNCENKKYARNKIKKEIVEKMLFDKKTQKEIALFFGVSIATLKRFLQENNLTKN